MNSLGGRWQISAETAKSDRGFTLVEVLIVVVIMAVLSAVVIPHFGSATDDAKQSTAESSLRTMRSLIQIYQAQHLGQFPAYDTGAKSLSVLLNKTRLDGTIDAVGGAYGPYLVEFPENPYTNKKEVKAITNSPASSSDVTAGNSGGWLYNATTGDLWLDSDPGYTY